MGRSHKKRPAASGKANRSENERLGRRLDNPNTSQAIAEQASRLVDDLIANGADLHYRAGSGMLMPSFHYELKPGGDRQRCRLLIAEAKGGSPLLWASVLQEIARRSKGVA